jgi:hypothetical protein
MTLQLADRGEFPAPVDGWPLPPEPLFVGSDQFEKLSRDLSRFVNGEVLGRSYLIAGHRGAGKTSLVLRVVQDLRTSILRESVKEEPQLPQQVGGLQRPLIVKLHGPSLLRPPDPPARPEKKAVAATGKEESAASKEGAPAPATAQPAPVEAGAHAALVQITVGLYRALAAEAALGFEVHARAHAGRGSPFETAELAAQLGLELDSGADPASLRRYWAAIDRIPFGVFWPSSADDTLAVRQAAGQGLREIMAIATAAQAFQVCTGQVTYDTTVKKSDVGVAETKTEASTDLKDVIGRVSTLGVGALTGVAVAGMDTVGTIAAIGAGLAVWLIGNFSLNWTITRTRTSDQKVNYSFIRDRTVTTLDRDLPLVIKRVREAGLAPVFVIDELDKVDDARERIGELVNQLKHLVTDYGFFCFLVNRDLFDEIEERVERLAYPVDHTYFSQRLLVRAEPNRLLVYLGRLLQDVPTNATTDFARTIFALAVMHRAKFNLADLTRAVADAAGAGDSLRISQSDLTSRKQLLTAVVQIAINEILRDPKLIERMRDDSSFAQLVVDTLYYPSRCWERGKPSIGATEDELAKYLRERMAPDKKGTEPREGPAEVDVKRLHLLLLKLLEDLAGFPALRGELGERPVFDDLVIGSLMPDVIDRLPRSALLHQAFPSLEGGASLVGQSRSKNLRYNFLFDSEGEKISRGRGPWSQAETNRAKQLLAVVKAFEAILKEVGVPLGELADAQLLPPIADEADFAASRRHVEAAVNGGSPGPSVSTGMDRLRRLVEAIGSRGSQLGAALLLVASVSRDADMKQGVLPKISRLIDFAGPPALWLRSWSVPDYPLGTSARALNAWRAAMAGRLMSADRTALVTVDPYDLLSERLPRYFESGESTLGPFSYEEVVLAARGEAPFRYLKANPALMDARDWSGLAIEVMPRSGQPAGAPYWVLIGALRGLGFGQPLLGELADQELTRDLIGQGWRLETATLSVERCMELARALAAGATPAKPGVLLIVGDLDTATGAQPPSRRRPTLIIGETDSGHYVAPLLWLRALDAFVGLADDEGSRNEAETV